MAITTEPVSDYFRSHFRRGQAEGLAEGRAEGIARGQAVSLLMILTARSIKLPEEIHDLITNCTDPDQLETWLARAATAYSLGEVFDPTAADHA